jgi:hypothetical protein
MAHIIAESKLDQPLDPEREKTTASGIDRALDLVGGRWLRSYYSPDRMRIICEFEAPDADVVAIAYANAGMPLERAWPAEVFAAESIHAD